MKIKLTNITLDVIKEENDDELKIYYENKVKEILKGEY